MSGWWQRPLLEKPWKWFTLDHQGKANLSKVQDLISLVTPAQMPTANNTPYNHTAPVPMPVITTTINAMHPLPSKHVLIPALPHSEGMSQRNSENACSDMSAMLREKNLHVHKCTAI